MPAHSERLHYLLEQYAAGHCSKKELLELFRAIDEAQHDETLQSSLQTIWKGISETDVLPPLDKEKIFGNIIIKTAPAPVISHKSFKWWRPAAAAIFILVSGSIVYIYSTFSSPGKIVKIPGNNMLHDRAPGGNKAILTLSDGSTIVLDSAHNGALTQQGNTKVVKLDSGQLAYRSGTGGPQGTGVQYNTIATPRGGQYQVVLPDGTKVWLNAASSLKFPTAFARNERSVDLAGEAYFEVAKNAGAPFKVHIITHQAAEPGQGSPGGEVEVLGTHFNVNAYDDEAAIKTTLLEGSVRVSKGREHGLLQPGQQAQLNRKGDLHLVLDANTEEAIAWKNGYFQFEEADVRTVMRQLARWYDVEVSYEGPAPERQFGGQMPRGVNLSEVLRILQESNVHFRIEGKKLVVTP